MRKKILSMFGATVLVILATGCASLLPQQQVVEKVSGNAENDVCEVYVMSVGRDTLYERFGKTNNPFIAPPMLITPRYFYVFSVTITARQDVTVRTDRIELIAGGEREHPDGVEAVVRFWKANSDNETPSEQRSTADRLQKIRQTLLPDTLNLVSGESYTGYIMFISSNPSLDPDKIIIPADSLLMITF